MAAGDPKQELHEYADGWITERKGTDAPPFLKLTYIVVAVGSIAYAWMFMNGEVSHDTRGALVRQFNDATGTANGFMYAVIAVAVVFAVVLWRFAFSRAHQD